MRTEYQKDKERLSEDGKLYFAGDLEKVIMSPRLPGLKKSIFTKRIILFNETFSPVGGSKGLHDTIAVLWHEGIKGRNDEDICNALCKLLSPRDVKNVLIL